MFTPDQARAVAAGYQVHLAALASQTSDWAMPVDQAQEHLDHVAGSASEHQNAYSMSRMQHRSGMQGVKDLARAGLHVVVMQGPAYCRYTDAIIGSHYSPLACFRDRADALAEVAATYEQWEAAGMDDECSLSVYPLPEAQQPERQRPTPRLSANAAADGDDDLPF